MPASRCHSHCRFCTDSNRKNCLNTEVHATRKNGRQKIFSLGIALALRKAKFVSRNINLPFLKAELFQPIPFFHRSTMQIAVKNC